MKKVNNLLGLSQKDTLHLMIGGFVTNIIEYLYRWTSKKKKFDKKEKRSSSSKIAN